MYKITTLLRISIGFFLLLLGVFALQSYPKSSWDAKQWDSFLQGTNWAFSRHDDTIISESLTLNANGSISGYSHDNEFKWKPIDGGFVFISKTDEITSNFTLAGYPDFYTQLYDRQHVLEQNSGVFSYLHIAVFLFLFAIIVWASPLFLPAKDVFTISAKSFGWWIGLIAIIFWSIEAWRLWFSWSYVADERWFFAQSIQDYLALKSGVQSKIDLLLVHNNVFGYGGLWWSFYIVFVYLAETLTSIDYSHFLVGDNRVKPFWGLFSGENTLLILPLYFMRLAVFVTFLLFLLNILRSALKRPIVLVSVFALLSMPIFYWSGKVASPELLAALWLVIAVKGWFSTKKHRWLILAATACSIKLTCLMAGIPLFCLALFVQLKKPSISGSFSVVGSGALGFLLGNLSYITNIGDSLSELIKVSNIYHPAQFIDQFWAITTSTHFTWDMTTYGSLEYWSGSLLLFFSLLAMAWIYARREFAVWLTTSFLLSFGFLMTQPYHSWYFFPVIIAAGGLVFLFPAYAGNLKPKKKILFYITLCCIFIGGVTSWSNVESEISWRNSHNQEVKSFAEMQQCTSNYLTDKNFTAIYDAAVLGKGLVIPTESQRIRWFKTYLALITPENIFPDNSLFILGPRAQKHVVFKKLFDSAKTKGECAGIVFLEMD